MRYDLLTFEESTVLVWIKWKKISCVFVWFLSIFHSLSEIQFFGGVVAVDSVIFLSIEK